MQLNIGIVEDDPHYTNELTSLIQYWEKQNYCQISLNTYGGSTDFQQELDNSFDLIFLDIQLTDGNGVDLAKLLRENGYRGEIVFLTSFREYVFEGYNVHALNYLLKPTSFESIKNCLDTVYATVNDENYIFRYRDSIVKIPYHNIIYFSSSNHHTEIYTEDQTYMQSDSLRSVIQHLPAQFVQCHRTTIINIQHVLQISGKNITLSNHMVIPASLTYIDIIRTAFVAQIQK